MLRWRKALGGALVVLAAMVAGVELAARATRRAHNERVRGLGDRLSVTVAGTGEPVIFLHGFRGSGRYWEPHVRELARERQVIVVDLLGFGRSPWPRDARYDVEDHLDALDRTLEPLLRGRQRAVIGHSMGSILAAEYARRHRAEVSRLVLLNAPMFRSQEEARSRIREMSPMAAMFSVQRLWARASCDLVCAFRPLLYRIAPRLEPDVPPDVARDSVLHRWESFDRTLQNVVLRSQMEETLRAIAPLPVTILHGTEDHITGRKRLETIARETGARLELLPGDHNMFLRHPQAVLARIAAALDGR
ncbi:MAG TPA: alpha/beta fold hydrolase [Thermoanaerobaculia bacterium]|nr:alpha/beta fold hydrolase [Thermoanaerobaculia bacterium]